MNKRQYDFNHQNPGFGAPEKINGAQFGLMRHNIIINSPLAGQFQSWPALFDLLPDERQNRWLLYVYGVMDEWGDDVWERVERASIFDETWKQQPSSTRPV